ncbi:hypothetical protein BC829DRAFT_393385 [Chytridium lagenaria]|nr:hypothetical protein BC829DRAFT_393385 [Chytridium lagenaria]
MSAPSAPPFQSTSPAAATAAARILASKPTSEPISRIILPERLQNLVTWMMMMTDGDLLGVGIRFIVFKRRSQCGTVYSTTPSFCFEDGRNGSDSSSHPLHVSIDRRNSFDGLLKLGDCLSDARNVLRFLGVLSAYEALMSGPFVYYNTFRGGRRESEEPSRVEEEDEKLYSDSGSDTDGDVDDSETSEDDAYDRNRVDRYQTMDEASESDGEEFAKYGKPRLAKRKTVDDDYESSYESRRNVLAGTETRRSERGWEKRLRDIIKSPDSFLRHTGLAKHLPLLLLPLDQLYFLHKHGILGSPTLHLQRSPKSIDYRRYSNMAWLSYLLLDMLAIIRTLSSVAESMAVVRVNHGSFYIKNGGPLNPLWGKPLTLVFSGGFSRVASAATSALGGGLSSLGGVTRTAVPPQPITPIVKPYTAPMENTEEHRMLMEELNGLYAELRILGLRTIAAYLLPMWAVGVCGTVSSAATLVLRWEYMMGSESS